MGCVASLPKSAYAYVSGTRAAPPACAAAAAEAAVDMEDGMEEASVGMHGAARTPPPPAAPPPEEPEPACGSANSEKLSPAALARLRDSFVAGASPGSVYDTYSLGETLGARARARA
jgi:hypothetical protein